MNPPPDQLKKLAGNAQPTTKKLFDKLKKQSPRNLDDLVHELHEDVFERTDCLTCANCCKTTSPIFYQKDIERVARHLRMKPGQFIEQYLHVDEDNDYVLNTALVPSWPLIILVRYMNQGQPPAESIRILTGRNFTSY